MNNMKEKIEKRIRDQIDFEKFLFDINKTFLGHQYSMLLTYTFGIIGIMIGFVAAFSNIWWLCLIIAIFLYFVYGRLWKNFNQERKRLEVALILSEDKINNWYKALLK